MKIDSVDFFYLAMPVVTEAADGSQDALLVRVTAGGHQGWGECEAAPAALDCGVRRADVARRLPAGVRLGARRAARRTRTTSRRMSATVAYNSMDLLQAAHTWSGIEMAMWDLLGRAARAFRPTSFSAIRRPIPKLPYASVLFGDDAGRDACARRADPRGGFPRREIRLGALRQVARQDDIAPYRRGARGSRARRRPADRRRARSSARTSKPPRCGSTRWSATASPFSRSRSTAPPIDAYRALGERAKSVQDGGRRGGAQSLHGRAPHRHTAGSATSRSTAGASAASGRRKRWRTIAVADAA